ncbi:MAG TPA: hypothetical protein VMD92_03695 [Acidobacteriaceae bacterium]|nr:hypothetical protein [Acidobacteriaceae bacterium]
MQPGSNPEDIHTILSRFDRWAGKEHANGNGHAKKLDGLGDGVREIPYEEAMRRVRSRKANGVTTVQPAAETPQKAAESDTPSNAAGVPLRLRTPLVSPAQPQTAAPAQATERPVTSRRGTSARQKSAPQKKVVAMEIKDCLAAQPVKKSLRSKPAAKKAAPATAEKPRNEAAPRKPTRATAAGAQTRPPQEFRQVLAKSVRAAKPADKPARTREKGRDQRVSVRLSRGEEHRLQACAAKAGVTISEYLRMRALETGTQPTGSSPRATAAADHDKPAVEASPEPAKRPASGLGDWIALLRNRFLASPTRFAERA